jgi:LemA protein
MAFFDIALLVSGFFLLVAAIGFMIYNSIIKARNRIQSCWAQIDAQLARRYDLIPNLTTAATALAKHEKKLLFGIADSRAAFLAAQTVAQKGEADRKTGRLLSNLFAIAESYPKMKSNEAFARLQEELVRTEDKIAFSRMFYNDAVFSLNLLVDSFPSDIVASLLRVPKAEYFQADAAAARGVGGQVASIIG